MPNEDQMTINERRKYLPLVKKRYVKANRLERRRLLDETEVVAGLHSKSLIRLMNGNLERKPHRKQRGRTYRPEVDDALQVIAESFDYLCAERLTPNLVWMATHLTAHGELEVSPPLLEKTGPHQCFHREAYPGAHQQDHLAFPAKALRVPIG